MTLITVLILTLSPQEFPVPEFDLEKVKATYVVSLPPDYDRTKRYPLILDFHGAIHPSRKGGSHTQKQLWSRFVKKVPCIVAGPNGRTRAWNQTRGEKDDTAYALHILEAVKKRFSIDESRITLAGFSSGSDFLCSGGLQLKGSFAGSLVTCPGPPNVVGIRDGSLARVKDHRFYFVAGEEDYIRKDGAWQAFVTLDKLGGRVMYREVPGAGHAFFELEEYARLLAYLEEAEAADLKVARAAMARGDFLMASTHLLRIKGDGAAEFLKVIEESGHARVEEAETLHDPGEAYEAWWQIATQFYRFEALRDRAQKELDALRKKHKTRDLFQARREWFRRRNRQGRAEGFDRYLNFDELTARLKALERDHPNRVRLRSMGKSIEGRDLWILELTDLSTGAPDTKPAAYLQGGIHGNEISSMMTVLYIAHQLATSRRRSNEKLLDRITVYVAPAVNPDASHHYVTEPHSHWRPRFNYRPHDADGDGKVDEDPYEDLNGDGQIGLMYREDDQGPYILRKGRLVRGEGSPRYAVIGREGTDNDGDGKFSEDPPGGVNLNRNFPVGFRARRDFEGMRGAKAASEPETQAIIKFVTAHPNIALFLDYHNDAKCLFYWIGKEPGGDRELFEQIAGGAQERLGYRPIPLDHAGAGLSIAWSYGDRGILSFIVELERGRGDVPEEAFLPAVPFKHAQLGDILLGNDYKKIAKRNPVPERIVWLADRNWTWIQDVLGGLPRLEIRDPVIEKTDAGFVVSGSIRNASSLPMDTALAARLGLSAPVTVAGARLGSLKGGGDVPFRVVVKSGPLVVSHPRGGTARLPVGRERSATRAIRKEYRIERGYATPDRARAAAPLKKDAGPAFESPHGKRDLRIAVLLGDWEDKRHSIEAFEFEKAFFGDYTTDSATGQPVYGSVRDFYREMSYGALDVTGKVFDWVRLPGAYADYRDASFGSSIVSERLMKAVGADLEGYDGIVFVWAGNAVRRTSALWPMRVTLKERPGVVAFKMGERHVGEMSPIGVACHELGHTFGVNDKYGLGATPNPLGPWCLMGRGTHGGGPSGRHRPFHFCAWCKMVIGWVKPVLIDPSRPQKLALRPILYGPSECYRILLKPDGSEYLLLENRRREGFFTDLPSPGLAVLRVGPNDLPEFPQKRVQLLPAHGLEPVGRGTVARPEAVAWPQKGKTECVIEGVRISEIRRVDDVIYFKVGPER